MKITVRWELINWLLFLIGMVGVWWVTQSLVALFWTWVASLHLSYTIKPTSKGSK